MKKIILLTALLLALLCASAAAGTIPEDADILRSAETFDQQLQILNRIAEEHADELENGVWNSALDAPAAPGLPEGLIPEDWESFACTQVSGLPEEMKGHRFAVVYCAADEEPALPGNLQARFPADMRASSLAEAEYIMVITYVKVDSGYQYTIPVTSFHLDYKAYTVNLKTGENTLFWEQRNSAKSSGQLGKLNGDEMTMKEIWGKIRGWILPEITVEQSRGGALLYSVSGKNCFLKDYSGEPAEVRLTPEVEGHPVTEIDMSFRSCSSLDTLIVEEGVTTLPDELLNYSYSRQVNLAVCVLPASLNSGLQNAGIGSDAVIYAPEGSYAASWAVREGMEWIAWEEGTQIPETQIIQEGDFTFRLFRGEAALQQYSGREENVTVPDSVGGMPVTSVLAKAFKYDGLKNLYLPESVRYLCRSMVGIPAPYVTLHVYIANDDIVMESRSLYTYHSSDPIVIHASVGSRGQEYAESENNGYLTFVPWGEDEADGVEGILEKAFTLAEKVQQSVSNLWNREDRKEYARLAPVPGYDIRQPESVIVLVLNAEQYDELALLMAGRENIARVFATIVNTQWDLPYAKAAARTVQAETFSPMADDSFVIAVLAYPTDMIMVTIEKGGNAHAALICSSEKIISDLTPEVVSGVAAQFGLNVECTVYDREALAAMQQ